MELTTGVLLRILKDEHVENPVLQVLQIKKLPSTGDKDRFRLLISDGKYQINTAMATGISTLEMHTVLKAKKHCLNKIKNNDKNKVLIIMDAEVLGNPGKILGDPVNLTNEMAERTEVTSTTSTASYDYEPPTQTNFPDHNSSLGGSRMINPISSLTPYSNKWVIKARVTNKGPMRTWSNSKGEGKLFSVDLLDESGEIRVTAFRDLADKYYNYLQTDKVYYFSKCQIKTANKQFNTLKNDYEMTLNNESLIEECTDNDGHVPQVKYDFVPLSKVAEGEPGTLLDVIGVCKDASDLISLTSRTTNRELKKRDVTLVDQSLTSVVLTLWGAQAESFDASNNPVVVIRAARIAEFGGGKTLSTGASSQVKVNPDIADCHRIKGWYDSEGKNVEVKNLSERSAGGMQAQWMCLRDVLDKNLGHSERGDYFQVAATILLIRSENALYKACPTDDCNKKVVDLENGMFRCEKCNREFPNFKYRLLVHMNIADFSGNQWVSMFSNEAEKILGKTSQELGLIMEDSAEAANAVFREANFKMFVFKCRAKMETYNDEQRMKIVVINVENSGFEKHCDYLAKQIKEMAGIDA